MIKDAIPVLRALRDLVDFLLAVLFPALFADLLLPLLERLLDLVVLRDDDFFDLLFVDFLRFTIFSSLWSEAKEHPRSTSAYNY